MTNLRNCKKCGKLFVSTGNMICNSCLEVNKDIYDKIAEYVAHRPSSTIFDVADALNVSTKKVLDLVREGNLELH